MLKLILKSTLEEIKSKFRGRKRKTKVAVVVGLLILAVILWQVSIFYQSQKTSTPSPKKKKEIVFKEEFDLIPTKGDIFGVKPDTSFIFKGEKEIKKKVLEEKLKASPEIPFEIREVKKKKEFEIIPKTSLKPKQIYTFSFSYQKKRFSWAFEVKTPFAVIATSPRNKSTSVPINTSIVISFNRRGFKNPERYFQISPYVEGEISEEGNELIFVPNEFLKPKTLYRVTIKRGLSLKNSQDVLSKDYTFFFETGEEMVEAYFEFTSDFEEALPGIEPAVEVFFEGVNVKSLKFNLYKLSNVKEFIESYFKAHKNKFDWTRFQTFSYVPPANKKILSFYPKFYKKQSLLVFPTSLDEGYYILETTFRGEKKYLWLQVSPISIYFGKTPENSILWVFDFKKKKPLKGAQVTFWKEKEKFLLGENGFLEFKTPSFLNENEETFLLIKKEGYQPKVVRVPKEEYEPDYYFNYLNTDRYLYRPSDKLYFWGAIKKKNGSLIRKKLKVKFLRFSWKYWGYLEEEEEENPPLFEKEVTVSNYGTFSGSFKFENLDPDFYQLEVWFKDKLIETTYFEIGIFSKPTYTIEIEPQKERIFTGEEAVFKIKARFFDGSPVAFEKIKYKAYLSWENIKEGEIQLNKDGEGLVKFKVPFIEGKEEDWPLTLVINAWPSLFEEGEIEGEGRMEVFGPRMQVNLEGESSEDLIKVKVKLNYIDLNLPEKDFIGKPVPHYPLKIEIFEEWEEKIRKDESYYDAITQEFRPVFEYVRNERILKSFTKKTDKNGELLVTFKPEKGKDYEIIVSGKDRGKRGFKNSISFYIPSSSEKRPRWRSYWEEWSSYSFFSFRPQLIFLETKNWKWKYKSGDKVEVFVQKYEGQPFSQNEFFLFYGYTTKFEFWKVTSSNEFSFIFKENYLPKIDVRAVWFSPRGFTETYDLTFYFDISQKNLEIEVSNFKEKYRPGDKVKFLIKTKKDGVLKSSRARIVVVDEALLAITPEEYYKEIYDFYEEEEWYTPLVIYSEYFLGGKSVAAEAGGCFLEGTKILTPDGEKKIEEVKIGDVVLTKKISSLKTMKKAVVQYVESYIVDRYLIINDKLKLTPEHEILLNGKWQPAFRAKKEDYLLNKKGEKIKITKIEIKRKPVKVYNLIVSPFHSFFAEGFLVHNEEKGQQERKHFPDLASFKDIEIKNGKRWIGFRLPDNLTSWRIIIEAIDDEGNIGKKEFNINVSLPFFVNLIMSENYLIEDEGSIIAKAFGEKYTRDKPVTFILSIPRLGFKRKVKDKDGRAIIPLPKVSKPGVYKITLFGYWKNYSDAVSRKIKFVQNLVEREKVKVYKLSENLRKIEGAKKGLTRIVIVDESKGYLYRFLREMLWEFGPRIETKIAPLIATSLLNKYFEEENPYLGVDLSSYISEEDGGFTSLPWSDSNVYISSLLANLSPQLFEKYSSSQFFEEILEDIERELPEKAMSLFGLASLSKLSLVDLKFFDKEFLKKLSLEGKIFIALSYLSLKDYKNARRIYYLYILPNIKCEANKCFLKIKDPDKKIKLTGLLASLALVLGEPKAVNFEQYFLFETPQKDLKILETLIYIKNFLEITPIKYKASFFYKIGKRKGFVDLSKRGFFEIEVFPQELSSLRFSKVKGKIQLQSWYKEKVSPQKIRKDKRISISKEIQRIDKKGKGKFKIGELVKIVLDPDFKNEALGGGYIIKDWIPAGFFPIFESGWEEKMRAWGECSDILFPFLFTGKNISFYWTKEEDKSEKCPDRKIVYLARVTLPGRYKVPSAIMQSEKVPQVITVSPSYEIEIEE